MSSFKHVLVLLKWCLLYYLHLTWSVLEQMDAQQGCSVGTLEHLGCVQANNRFKTVNASSLQTSWLVLFLFRVLFESFNNARILNERFMRLFLSIRFNILRLLGVTAVCMCGTSYSKRHKGEFYCLGWRVSGLSNRDTATLNVENKFVPDILLLLFLNLCGECYLMNM